MRSFKYSRLARKSVHCGPSSEQKKSNFLLKYRVVVYCSDSSSTCEFQTIKSHLKLTENTSKSADGINVGRQASCLTSLYCYRKLTGFASIYLFITKIVQLHTINKFQPSQTNSLNALRHVHPVIHKGGRSV